MTGTTVMFRILISCAILTVVAGCGKNAQTTRVAGFSADVILTHKEGKQQATTYKEKVFYKDHKVRVVNIYRGRPSCITISRRDKRVIWIITPANKVYREMDAYSDAILHLLNTESIKKQADVKELGYETIKGYRCRKIRYTWHRKAMGIMTLWVATQLDYPIKTLMKSDYAVDYSELKNIKEQAPPDSMFELPHGYKKVLPPIRPKSLKT